MKSLETIILDGHEIKYELERKKVKNLNLRIRADGSVYVSVSHSISKQYVENFLRFKTSFILKGIESRKKVFDDKEEKYEDGAITYFLGKPCVLQVISGAKNQVVAEDGHIEISVKDMADPELIKKTYKKWRDDICIRLITKKCVDFVINHPEIKSVLPTIRFRNMTTRWGTCNFKKGILTFSYLLIETPIECIEYIVTHEFCHFAVHDHSQKFYDKVEYYMPDWRSRQKLLSKKSYRMNLNDK